MASDKESMDKVFRERQKLAAKYSLDNPGNQYNFKILRDVIENKVKALFSDYSSLRMLDLGAGELFWPDQFLKMGLSPNNCIGADILLWRLKEGRRNGRRIPAIAASASNLPFADNCVDIAFQMTMMTSVLDSDLRCNIAEEMKRIVKPGGYIFWYDFRFNNPANPDTRAIKLSEIRRLYSGWPVQADKITLLPPLTRRVARFSTGFLNLLSLLPILRTHYLAIIGPKG